MERTGNAQQDTQGHTQHTHCTHTQQKAQRRTTRRTNTPRQKRHSTEHTARGKTTKHSAGKHRNKGRRTAPEGTRQQATVPKERNNTSRHKKRTMPGRATRSNAAQHPVTQHSTPHCKVFGQPIFSLSSVYFPDICVQTGIGYLSTVLNSVGTSQSRCSVVLH